MKRLFTFIALVAMSIGAWAWTWTNEAASNGTGVNGSTYYLYAEVNGLENRFLNANTGFDANPTISWTVSGAFPGNTDGSSSFTLTSSSGTNFSMYSAGSVLSRYTAISTNETKSGDDIKLAANYNSGSNTYGLVRYKKASGNRNVEVTSSGITTSGQANATSCWKFISANQVNVYNNCTITFTGDPRCDETMGSVSVQNATYELTSMADNNQEHRGTVTFKAVAKPGYVFVGWSETEGGAIDSIEGNYEVELTFSGDVTVSNSITKTLYANFEVGVVTPTIETVIDKLDWYTTYNVADLFASTNTESALVVKNGEDEITSFTTKNESSITLTVSQAAVEGKYYAVENQPFTFTVAKTEAYARIIDTKSGMSKLDGSRDNFTWVNNGSEADSISFYSETSNNVRQYRLYQYINGTLDESTYYTIGNSAGNKKFALNPAATGVQIRNEGTGWGSATVTNLVATRRTYLKSETTAISENAHVGDPVENTLVVEYGNIHTVGYELTDITPATANITLTTNDVLANGARDYGKYNFKVSASSEDAGTITANAHFFTSEDKHLIIPITIVLKHTQTLSWTSAENIEINVDGELSASATATSDLDVAYSSSNESVVKYENGAWVVVGAGEATIYADQAGNDSYEAATQISKQVTVKKLTQTLSWSDEVSSPIFDNAELNVTATATSGLAVTYGSNNADVIKYEDGAWVVAGVGTATIHASQAGNDTYQAADQIYMTITVLSAQTSKESGVNAWTNMPTESETASMYVTTNGETLITKTAQYKHGTICLPYSGTVSGATLYRLVNSEKDEVGNVNGLVFEFLGEDAASSCNFEAGMPYVYFANDAQQAWTRTNNTSVDVQAKTLSNGLTGTYERKKLTNNEYFLYTADDSFHKAGTNVVVPAFRAYITTEDMENVADLQTPGKAQIRFGFEGYKPVATGMENAVVMNATKALVNGKIVIIRGDKAYTINGSKIQ